MRILTAILLAGALLVAGCSGESTGAKPTETRSYTDASGRVVELPARPQRVVALSEPSLDNTIALGIRPVGTTNGRGQGTAAGYLGDRAAEVKSVGTLAEPELEQIAKLRPDVILIDGTAGLKRPVRTALAQIAPTVFVSKNAADWREVFAATAKVLGREPEGESMLADYADRVAAIKGRLGQNAGAEVSIVRWGGIGLPAVLKEELPSGHVLRELGLRRPPAQRGDGPGHSVPVSYELIDQLDGDWIFFGSLGAGGPTGGESDDPADPAAARRALKLAEDTPGFKKLRAFRAGRIVPVDGSAWTSAGGYLAEQIVLDDIERSLAS